MNQIVICVLAVVAVALAQHPDHAKMEQDKKDCQAQVGATDADRESLRPFQVPQTKGASCILACMKKKMGWMNADNTFNVAAATEKLTHMKEHNPEMYNKMMTVFQTCKSQEVAQSDQCLAAQALAECFKTQKAVQGLPDMPPPRP